MDAEKVKASDNKYELVDIDRLIPYENNPRINEQAVDAVAESIKQCGYVSPIIVDENYVVLAGHTRLKALQKLNAKKVRVIIAKGMTEEQKKKYRLLDNKTAEKAEWDYNALALELEDIDFEGFDFEFDEEFEMIDGGDSFTLPDGDQSGWRTMTLTLTEQQLLDIERVLESVEIKDNPKANDGTKIHEVCIQWEARKILN